MTLSPTFTPSGCRRPSSRRLPLPTATSSASICFSWAVSGMMMPDLVLVSAANGFNRSRSCSGLNFMVLFLRLGTGAAYRKRPRRVSTRLGLGTAAVELGGGGRVERDRQMGHFLVVAAVADVAVAVQPGDRGAIAERHVDDAWRSCLVEAVADRLEKLVDALTRQGRDRIVPCALRAGRRTALEDVPIFLGERIDLVQRLDENRAALFQRT